MIRLISHCHTHHSFDSSMSIEAIIEQAVRYSVNMIIINDHDTYGLSNAELELFSNHGITVLPAIEFTTKEGVHVIGVHEDIRCLEQAPFYYDIEGLLNRLKSNNAKVIFPHPYHATGVYGNKNITNDMFEKYILFGDAFEIDNYRYGETPKGVTQ